jgi:hypothetical protein
VSTLNQRLELVFWVFQGMTASLFWTRVLVVGDTTDVRNITLRPHRCDRGAHEGT